MIMRVFKGPYRSLKGPLGSFKGPTRSIFCTYYKSLRKSINVEKSVTNISSDCLNYYYYYHFPSLIGSNQPVWLSVQYYSREASATDLVKTLKEYFSLFKSQNTSSVMMVHS